MLTLKHITRLFSTNLPYSKTPTTIYFNVPTLWTCSRENLEYSNTIKKEHFWFPWITFGAQSFQAMEHGLFELQEKGSLLVNSQGDLHRYSTKLSNPFRKKLIDFTVLEKLRLKLSHYQLWSEMESHIFYHDVLDAYLNDWKCKQWKMVRFKEPLTQSRKDCIEWELGMMEVIFKKELDECCLEAQSFQTIVAILKQK